VRLASFNLLHGRSLPDGQVLRERLHDAVQLLEVDVVGLQEVDRAQSRSEGRDLTAEVARTMGADAWRFVPALVGTPGAAWRVAADADDDGVHPSYGCGLVSRYPVLDWHTVRLAAARVRSPLMLPGTRKVVWLQDEPRVGIAAVVETPLGVMTIATTHLSFVPGWNGVQLRRLCHALEALPGPRVLLGDLNMPPPFPRLLSGWQPLAKVPTYPAPQPRVQLDHVLGHGLLPSVRSVETPVLPVSDHRALDVEL
jgi:endonuclease/exonuclease/phosphatase family metal-dependent hydrolase